MGILIQYRDQIQMIPIFVLTLGCGVGSGTLLSVAFITYLITCKLYHENILGDNSVCRTKIFAFSCFILAFWLICLLIPMYWTGGDYGLLLKYAGRALPLLLFCLIVRPQKSSFFAIWLGFIVSLSWIELDTLCHPRFSSDHRLMGTFGWFNTLAEIIALLIPGLIIGIIKYKKRYKKICLWAAILYSMGLGTILLTGSRAAYIVCAVVIAFMVVFLLKIKDKFSLKWGSVFLVLCIVLGTMSASPQMINQRLHKNLHTDGRVWLIQVSLDIYDKYPNTGVGVGNWGKIYHANYELPGKEKNIGSPHNIFLQTVNESGRIGLIGILTMFLSQLIILLKNGFVDKNKKIYTLRWTTASFLLLISVLVLGMMDYGFFSRHSMYLFWFYWGLAIADISYHKRILLAK